MYGHSSVKGGRGLDLPEILHIIYFFSSCFAKIFPTVLPEFGRAVAPLPPASYAYGRECHKQGAGQATPYTHTGCTGA